MTDTATRTAIVERQIPYPPEKIWRALTQPHLLADWLMPVGMNGMGAGELARVSVAAAETAATVKTAAAILRALRNVRSNLVAVICRLA